MQITHEPEHSCRDKSSEINLERHVLGEKFNKTNLERQVWRHKSGETSLQVTRLERKSEETSLERQVDKSDPFSETSLEKQVWEDNMIKHFSRSLYCKCNLQHTFNGKTNA